MPPAPLSADAIAAREWPGLRAKILDIAAALDRLDRAGAVSTRQEAERLLASLIGAVAPDRAERLLELLSRPYEPMWREKFAAGEKTLP